MPGDLILHGDNLALMADFADGAFRMVYADPPFNTGRSQTRTTVRVTPDAAGDKDRIRRAPLRTELLERMSTATVRRLPRVPRAAPARDPPPHRRGRARSICTSTSARRTT